MRLGLDSPSRTWRLTLSERGDPSYHVAAEATGTLPLPFYFEQLGSFESQHLFDVLANIVAAVDLEPWIREIAVECITFDALCRRHGLERLDLLHIDAEGADYEILQRVDFRRYRPTVVLFEHMHLTAAEKQGAVALLRRANYRLREVDVDMLAIRTPELDG